ncbi:unnamed protein product, partial [Iphiclides podalirius]
MKDLNRNGLSTYSASEIRDYYLAAANRWRGVCSGAAIGRSHPAVTAPRLYRDSTIDEPTTFYERGRATSLRASVPLALVHPHKSDRDSDAVSRD